MGVTIHFVSTENSSGPKGMESDRRGKRTAKRPQNSSCV